MSRGTISHITKPRHDSTPQSLQPHTNHTPRERSVAAALQHLDPMMPLQPLERYPTSGLVGAPGVVLILHQPGHRAKARREGEGGKESLLHPQGFCPQSRAHKYPLPTHSITLSVAASSSSHSGGKMVLLVAIIKTGRGRHLLFSATAEIALLTQTFWS